VNIFKYFIQHLLIALRSERGDIGGAFSALFGGGKEETTQTTTQKQEYTPEQRRWMQTYYPQLTELSKTLSPLLTQRLQQPGLPPELEQSVWNLARQRLATGYEGLGNQIGNIASSRGMLQSGPVFQNWLNQVGLARAQGEQGMGVERAMANYQAMQDAINQSMTYMGLQGVSPSGQTSTTQTQQPTDYSGMGSLFAKAIGMFGNKTGTQAGSQFTGVNSLYNTPTTNTFGW
jgi:hypothetical protein